MKKYLALSFTLGLLGFACSPTLYYRKGCEIDAVAEGMRVTCYGKSGPGSVSIHIIPKGDTGEQGPKGDTGSTGPKGENGVSFIPTVTPTDQTLCPDASESPTGVFGQVITLTPSDGSQTLAAVICNGNSGSDGQDGEDGEDAAPTPFSPTELVDPCGDSPTAYDEVLIKLANGMLLATVSDNASGLNTRLSRVLPGTWTTTDGDHCIFTVDANNEITYESHRF